MRQSLHIQAHHVTRPLMVLCGVAVGLVCVMAAWHRSIIALTISLAMVPLMALLIRQARRHAGALRDRAQHHADTAAEAERHYFEVLREVMSVAEGRDQHTAGRSERISRLVTEMAKRLSMEDDLINRLAMVARVHDIGLLSVPAQVLAKPMGLNGPEYSAVRKHAEIGHRMLQPLRFLAPVLDAVLYHHERMNGTGYPEGLVGDSIPLVARILAVADSYDAMTHDRPHRAALTSSQAVAELIRCAGEGYDCDCVAALASAVNMTDLLPEQWQNVARASRPCPDAPAPALQPVG